ncbi:MAG: 30S ribosomal protein S1 [Chloroflexi bacterium]|nr:MAG: 30S ribosomal protein S1 [Chloroflexota bacterium]
MSENNGAPVEIKVGAEIKGTVKNIELYGAFVDIGGGRDALLHISQLGKRNVRNVEDVVKVGEEITAYVIKVDDEGRIALSLVKPPQLTWDKVQVGETYKGTVTRIEKFGVFVDIGAERPGMVHVSELADTYVKSPSDVVSVGDEVEVRVIKVNRRKRQIDLSMKSPAEEAPEAFEDEAEEIPTAMALAFRRAMEEQAKDDSAERQRKKSREMRNEQDDIIARTLKQVQN